MADRQSLRTRISLVVSLLVVVLLAAVTGTIGIRQRVAIGEMVKVS